MKLGTYNVMIAERDIAYRDKLAGIIYEIETRQPGVEFNLLQPSSIEEIEAVFEKSPPQIAFIDHNYFLQSPDELARLFEQADSPCELVMMIDGKDGTHISEILDAIDARRSLHLSGHLLKSDYSEDLTRVLVNYFIRRIEQ